MYLVSLFSEFIDTVDVSLYRSRDDIGIGTETVIHLPVVFHLHVYFTYIVTSLADSLYGKLFQSHLALDDLLYGLDSGIHRPVSGSGCLKMFT